MDIEIYKHFHKHYILYYEIPHLVFAALDVRAGNMSIDFLHGLVITPAANLHGDFGGNAKMRGEKRNHTVGLLIFLVLFDDVFLDLIRLKPVRNALFANIGDFDAFVHFDAMRGKNRFNKRPLRRFRAHVSPSALSRCLSNRAENAWVAHWLLLPSLRESIWFSLTDQRTQKLAGK